MEHLYRHPLYYEIAFCSRPVDHEIRFIVDLHTRHGLTGQPIHILDHGCGTGLYLEALARQFQSGSGISGIRLSGYDLSPEMAEFARNRLKGMNLPVSIDTGDLRTKTFTRTHTLAICMNGSFQYLLENNHVISHLRCAANSLAPGGLYLISLPAPECFFAYPPGQITSRWDETSGPVSVSVNWTWQQDEIDWVRQVFSGEARIFVTDDGATREFSMPYVYRIFTLPEISALVRLAGGLEIFRVFGDFNIHCPFSARGNKYMNILFRRV